MSTEEEELMGKLFKIANRLARKRASQLTQRMRNTHDERLRARRDRFRKRTLFGRVLIQEGLVDWTPDEVRGMVLHVLDEMGASPTVRLGFRKRAAQSATPVRGPPTSMASS